MILIPFLPLFFTLLIFVGFGVTVTLQVALAELLNVAVMYTFPADFAVIFPFLSTVAIFVLEDWNKDADYDRLGLEEKYVEYLGNKVAAHTLPIRPGRNLAIIVEAAAINHRQKKMGYNAAEELYKRVTGQMED